MEESSRKYSFEHWNLVEFLRGRKKLIIAVVGFIIGQVTLKRPDLAVLCAGVSDCIYAIIEYFVKEG